MDTNFLYVHGRLAYVGDGSPHADLAVSAIRIEIAVPTARVGVGTPTASGAGWSYASQSSSAGTTTFIFLWAGANLTAATSPTVELVATIPKATDISALSVTLTGRGTSNSASVPAVTQTVSAGLMGSLVASNGTISYNANFYNGSANVPVYLVSGALQWSGPYSPVGSSISSIQVVTRIPTTRATGTVYPQYSGAIGAGWSAVGAPVSSGGFWVFTYNYAGTLTSASPNTTNLALAFQAIGASVAGAVQVTITAVSAGQTITVVGSGP